MKKFILNNLIAILAIIVIIFFLTIIYLAAFTERQRENYSAITTARVNSISDEADKIIAKGKSDIVGFDHNASPVNGYYAYALLNGSDTSITLNRYGGDPVQYELKQNAYSKISSDDFGVFVANDIFKDTDIKSSLLCFTKATEHGIVILFKKAEDIFSNYSYDFDNIMLIDDSGLVLTDYNSDYIAKTLYLEEFFEKISSQTEGFFYTDFAGGKKLMAFCALQTDGYKIAAYIPQSKEESYINRNTGSLILYLVLMFILTAVLAMLIIFAYIKQLNEMIKYKHSKRLYIVYTDNMGKIRKSNKAFKTNFEYENIFDNLMTFNNSVGHILQNNLPAIIALKDREGKERYIIFFTLNTNKGYKLIGEDSGTLLTQYRDNLYEIRNNEKFRMSNATQFNHDFERAQTDLRIEDGLYALFDVKNVGKYRSMFGEEFYNALMEKLAELLRKLLDKFGTVYYSDKESFLLFIVGTEKVKAFKEKAKSILIELNQPIHVDKSLIKADCVAGAVELVGDVKEKPLKEITLLAEYTVEKISEAKLLFGLYDGSQSRYFASYNRKKDIVKHIIDNNLIDVYYQPQYSLSENRIIGLEALSRIQGGYDKDMRIQELIEIAEKTGYMIKLGDFVFKKAFEFAKSIEDMDVTISLNVSPVQLLQSGFVSSFLELFESYNLRKGIISIEITETFIMTSFNDVISKLIILRDNGINIHLDDFGVAYSSMLYLKKLPISTIKIDKEFVNDMDNNIYSKAICSKIIGLANDLGLDSIAEGVETKQQMDTLKELGCKTIQGFYISAALNSEAIKKRLIKGR